MARVLIGEPSPEVRDLLVRLLVLDGHEAAVLDDESAAGTIPDVYVFEPDSPQALELAHALRRRSPGLALVVCSIHPATPETRELEPVEHLLKPFRRADLAAAIAGALAAAPSDVSANAMRASAMPTVAF